MKKNSGFTLIELLVAITIFAIISLIAYRTIASLVTTKQVITRSQNKWGKLTRAINRISFAWNAAIPLTIRDQDGNLQPALLGKAKLDTNTDAQLEFTTAGYIGSIAAGSTPPKRIGFRFVGNSLYLVTWPVLNRSLNTQPRIDLLLSNIQTFTVSYFYPDQQWRDAWPADSSGYFTLPVGIKVYIKLSSGEEITRLLAI